jgi:heme-degrading monooxygenase HmoA
VFARVHVLQTTPEQSDTGLEIVRDQLLPWMRDTSGFRGLIRLLDRENGRTLVISLWADEEALQASTDAGEQFAELTAQATGSKRLGLDIYEATLFDV